MAWHDSELSRGEAAGKAMKRRSSRQGNEEEKQLARQ
jgi:hypothetical protein